jgi:hypothetical protein
MRYVSYIVLLSFFSCTSLYAQYGIVKKYVFTQNNFAGNIAIDDQGNPLTPGVTSTVFIYLQTKSAELPLFDTAEFNGKIYIIDQIKLKERKYCVGKSELDEKPIYINFRMSNNLYKLTLTPNIIPALQALTQPIEIKLFGKYKKQKIKYLVLQKPVPLYSLPIP